FLGVHADLPASEGDEPASTATPTAVTA
ncbi:MAG: hypothetical protein QOF04_1892, partial [Solirubrobacteraceae bacterium]|nr:hypothetical protein [Solirubrobacteraceae bacterium]